jgi:glyoxylase-like metal-dependent hydrolase (beta-lactamase superfamily II)
MKIIELKLSVTNCFLIKTQKNYILVDTGYVYDWDLFCKKLEEASVSLHQISHIILTHHHDDHCGLLNKITEINSNIIVVMSHHAKDLLLKGKNDRTHGGGLINKRIKFLLGLKQLYISIILKKKVKKEDNLKFPPYKVRKNDILISGEKRLDEVGIQLNGKLIETPGHSTDHISLVFDDGDCIIGDAAANFLQFAGTKYCVVFITDIDLYYKSWRKLISQNVRRVFPAHGKSFIVEKLVKNIGKNKTLVN